MGGKKTEYSLPLSRKDFEDLFRTEYSSLCSYACHFLHDSVSAEEVVQEVMLRIWMNRETLSIATSLHSYLFRSVRNGCLNALKHDRIREEYRTLAESGITELASSGEEVLISSELNEKIRQAIDELPMERRKIFIMSRYDGLTYTKIAEKLGISQKTVENQMGKALKSLREKLSDYLPWLFLFLFNQKFFE